MGLAVLMIINWGIFHLGIIEPKTGEVVLVGLKVLHLVVLRLRAKFRVRSSTEHSPSRESSCLPDLRTHKVCTKRRTVPCIVPSCAIRIAIDPYASGEMGLHVVM